MKKNLFLLLICVFLTGCSTTLAITENVTLTGKIEQIQLVEKNFDVLGIIYITSTVKIDENGSIIEGSKITYEMLLREAQKMGADDIANLRIDEILRNTEYQTLNMETIDYNIAIVNVTNRVIARREIIYNATALAIKYK